MTSPPLRLVWHRRDLRINDHIGLSQACAHTPRVVGVFCLDPAILGRDDLAPVRIHYLIGSLEELHRAYERMGGTLLIFKANPIALIPTLAETLNVEAVHWHHDVEVYAKERDRQVSHHLQARGIRVETCWDQLIHSPDQISTQQNTPYTVYSPFWRNWVSLAKPAPVAAPTRLIGLTAAEVDQGTQLGAIALPTAQELGFHWDGPLILEPGERAAKNQLDDFTAKAIYTYGEARNYPGQPGTALLSPSLKFGVVGIRQIWAASEEAMAACNSDEARASVQTWQKELAWREFYQHVMYWFPELEAGPYRQGFATFPWDNRPDYFEAWCQGQTGYPIVDAAMRQLNETGWMHNRCRMIVASFLTKDLVIQPQWGEKYFMQHLIDGDVSSNNGGWQWSASSGMDPKPLRIFNPASQAQKFDPEGDYIRQWLPELRGIDTADLLTGQITPLDRQRCDYPAAIVDHRVQQQQFKALYQRHFKG